VKTYTRDVSGFDHPIHVNRDETSQGVVTNAIVAQLVEHNLAKVRVAGSNPVYRSMKLTEDGLAPLKGTLTSWE
jgi:hypothetical protein